MLSIPSVQALQQGLVSAAPKAIPLISLNTSFVKSRPLPNKLLSQQKRNFCFSSKTNNFKWHAKNWKEFEKAYGEFHKKKYSSYQSPKPKRRWFKWLVLAAVFYYASGMHSWAHNSANRPFKMFQRPRKSEHASDIAKSDVGVPLRAALKMSYDVIVVYGKYGHQGTVTTINDTLLASGAKVSFCKAPDSNDALKILLIRKFIMRMPDFVPDYTLRSMKPEYFNMNLEDVIHMAAKEVSTQTKKAGSKSRVIWIEDASKLAGVNSDQLQLFFRQMALAKVKVLLSSHDGLTMNQFVVPSDSNVTHVPLADFDFHKTEVFCKNFTLQERKDLYNEIGGLTFQWTDLSCFDPYRSLLSFRATADSKAEALLAGNWVHRTQSLREDVRYKMEDVYQTLLTVITLDRQRSATPGGLCNAPISYDDIVDASTKFKVHDIHNTLRMLSEYGVLHFSRTNFRKAMAVEFSTTALRNAIHRKMPSANVVKYYEAKQPVTPPNAASVTNRDQERNRKLALEKQALQTTIENMKQEAKNAQDVLKKQLNELRNENSLLAKKLSEAKAMSVAFPSVPDCDAIDGNCQAIPANNNWRLLQ